MDAHVDTPRIQILSVSDTGRRRRWTDDEKVRIVEESLSEHGRVAETARRHDVGRTLLVRWRRQYREGRLTMGGVGLLLSTLSAAFPSVIGSELVQNNLLC